MSNIKTLQPFKKGHDPRRNTKGRPKVSYAESKFDELLESELDKLVPGTKNTYGEMMVRRVILDAIKGKYTAYKFLSDRVYGKPKFAERTPGEVYYEPDDEIDEKANRAVKAYMDGYKE